MDLIPSPSLPLTDPDRAASLDKADRAIRLAARVGFLMGGATLLLGVYFLLAGRTIPEVGLDGWITADGVLVFLLSYGVHRRSRACAVSLLVYFLLGKAVLLFRAGVFEGKTPSLAAPVMTILIARVLVSGTWGTFVYRRLGGEPARRGWTWWKVVLAVGGGLVALAIIALVSLFFYRSSKGVSTTATRGEDLPARAINELQSLSLLRPGERVIHFYSGGFLDIDESLCFFTSDRVEWYSKDWEKREYSVALADVEEIPTPEWGTGMSDTRIRLVLDNGGEYVAEVGNGEEGDHRFFDALTKAWKQARGAVHR